MNLLEVLRRRYHPLHHARAVPGLRQLLRIADIECWARLEPIAWPVRIRAVRHCSYRVLRRSPEPGVTAFFQAVMRVLEPQSVWDVGANFGYFGFLAKSVDPRTHVTFVEPDGENAALIEATIARSGVTGFDLHQVAASDAAGEATFVTDRETGATGTLETSLSFAQRRWNGAQPVRVRTATLDQLIGADDVDLLKLDVEGHEERALTGAMNALRRCQPIVVFECFHGGAEINGVLRGMGYTICDADTTGQTSTMTTNFAALPSRASGSLCELERLWKSLL